MTVMPGKGIIAKLQAAWEVMKRGREVFDPVKWKLRQITYVHVAAFISSALLLSRNFGYDINLSQEEVNGIATTIMVIASVFNHFTTVATTPEINVLGRKDRRASERDGDEQVVVTTGKRQEPLQPVDSSGKGYGTTSDSYREGNQDIATIKTKLQDTSGATERSDGDVEKLDQFAQARIRDSQGG